MISQVTTQGSALRGLGPLLSPQSVAIIGASERRSDVVTTVLRSCARTWLVNPRRESLHGVRCYSSLASLPEVPEVAFVVVGHQAVEAAVTEALAAGVQSFVVPGLGAEAGRLASPVADRLAELVRTRGEVPLLGTNCMGYAQPDGPSLYLGTLSRSFLPGHVSVVSQSGSAAEALICAGPRFGFRTVVSSGTEIVRDAADFLGAFAADDGTQAVGVFLETVRRPEAFAKALKACAEANKPIVCLKVGRSSAATRVALTHTGAIVGSARSFSAFLAAYGAIEVFDMTELVETLAVLGRRQRPRGRRVAVVGESGGEVGLIADLAEGTGLSFAPLPEFTAKTLHDEFPNLTRPQNPLDVWAIDEVDRVFPRTFQVLCEANAYDIVVAAIEITRYRGPRDQEWCQQVVEALAAATDGTSIFPAVLTTIGVDAPDAVARVANEAGIPLLRGTRTALGALAAVAGWHARIPGNAPPSPFPTVNIADLMRPGTLPEWESATILQRYGVRFSPFRRVHSPTEAARAAEELGFPVVVKVDGPAHKSVGGGVILGITDAEKVSDVVAHLGGSALVAHQVPPGREVMCGMHRDSTFGAVLSIGIGGTLAEVLGASATWLAPVTPEDAEALIARLPGAGEIARPAYVDLLQLILALSQLTIEHPEVGAVDVNPVVLTDDGAVAVDALVEVGNV